MGDTILNVTLVNKNSPTCYQQSSKVYTLHLINECPLDIELMYETAYWIKH